MLNRGENKRFPKSNFGSKSAETNDQKNEINVTKV